MTHPQFRNLLVPMLQILSKDGEQGLGELKLKIADRHKLSDAEVNARTTDGKSTVLGQRIKQAKDLLRNVGYVRSTGDGTIEITKRGAKSLALDAVEFETQLLDREIASGCPPESLGRVITRKVDVAPPTAGFLALNAEIGFHEQEVVSIFHESNCSGTQELFAELVFAAEFAIRSISNLGPHEITDALGVQLRAFGRLMLERPSTLSGYKPTIIPYPGNAGKKRFIASLRVSKDRSTFDYKAKGFGWLATGVGYYCPAATHSVFRYFAHRHQTDIAYVRCLGNVAIACGELQAAGHIQIGNHSQLVMSLAAALLEEFTPRWLID